MTSWVSLAGGNFFRPSGSHRPTRASFSASCTSSWRCAVCPFMKPLQQPRMLSAAQPQPSPGSQDPAESTDGPLNDQSMSATLEHAQTAEPQSSTVNASTDQDGSILGRQPPPEPVWMDLRGSRMLAPVGVPAKALPQGFVAAEAAGAEQVLTELLGVRRVSEAETYRCERHHLHIKVWQHTLSKLDVMPGGLVCSRREHTYSGVD